MIDICFGNDLCSPKSGAIKLQGDFLVHFMDIAREELLKKHDEISVEKLQVYSSFALFFFFIKCHIRVHTARLLHLLTKV